MPEFHFPLAVPGANETLALMGGGGIVQRNDPRSLRLLASAFPWDCARLVFRSDGDPARRFAWAGAWPLENHDGGVHRGHPRHGLAGGASRLVRRLLAFAAHLD